MNRAQVSLVFEDDDLFNNLILSLKQSRNLSPLIIKCLSAYYYKPDVRHIVDGFEGEEEERVDIQQELDEIRNALFMQSVFAEEATNILNDGTEEMTDILSYSEKRMKEHESGNYQAEPQKQEIPKQIEKMSEKAQEPSISDRMDRLENMVMDMYEMFKAQQNVGVAEASQPYEVEDDVEKSSLNENEQVSSEIEADEPKEPENSDFIDGTESLLALLNSM